MGWLSPLILKSSEKTGIMGRVFFSFDDYDKVLDMEIEEAMQNPDGRIQKNAKDKLVASAYTNVYKHDTKFDHPVYGDGRRWGDGGILDPETYRSERHSDTAIITKNAGKGFTLHIYADAPWRQLFGGNPSDNPDDLSDAIEKNGLYSAPKSEWMEKGGDEYAKEQFGKDLVKELEDAGL